MPSRFPVSLPVHPGTRALLGILTVIIILSAVITGSLALTDPFESSTERFTFTEVASERGLDYTYEGNQVVNGNAGAYVADYNNDQWSDLLLIGNESRGPVLYRNTGGSFAASDDLPDEISEYRIHSALFFDYDNDNWTDLLLLPDPAKPSGGYAGTTSGSSNGSRTSQPLLLTNHNGNYSSPKVLTNITLQQYPIGATSADADGDGCLDVFIYQNGDWGTRTPAGFRNPGSIGNISDDNGEPNLLLSGDCQGSFTDISESAGIEGQRWSLAASFVDLNGDTHPDIHVANDFNQDTLYLNQGNGTFVQHRINGTDRNGMSSEIADINGDLRPDIFVTNIGMADRQGADLSKDTGKGFDRQAASQSPRYTRGNQLLINQGNGEFEDRAASLNVKRAPFVWGWAAVMADLDNDADLDLIHTNNEKSSVTSEGDTVLLEWTDTPPGIWENTGTLTAPSFHSVTGESIGLIEMNARGLVRLDYDRDGDLDLIAADEANDVKLFENQVRSRHWLQIALGPGRSATGLSATVSVTSRNGSQLRMASARTDFLSQESPVLHVGFGKQTTPVNITVIWRNGSKQVYADIRLNQRIILYESGMTSHADR